MIGVTIGIGEGWGEVARAAARQMERMTGLRCEVVDDELRGKNYPLLTAHATHPSWLKCLLLEAFPEENEFLIFDADVICVRPWEPKGLFVAMGRAFCAVAEERTVSVMAECQNHRLPFPDWYVNGGLLMCGREHAAIWEQVWEFHPRYGSWLEQTALNEVLYRTGTEMVRLPRVYNTMLHGDASQVMEKAKRAVNVHADSFGGRAEEVRKLQRLLLGD